MPEHLAPGVFVEETSFRSKSIEGVSTTTTGFVGPCRYGPVTGPGEPITSLAEFERNYGGGAKLEFAEPMDNFLWHGVRAFFNEGGKRLYVARVFRSLAGEYPPDFTRRVDLNNDPLAPLWADGHASATFGGALFRSRFPGKESNLIVGVTASLGENDLSSEDVLSVLTISIQIQSADRKQDLGTWSGLSLDPKLDHTNGRQSVFGLFCESPATPSEAGNLPLVVTAGAGTNAIDTLVAMFPDILTVTNEHRREFSLLGGNDGLRPGAGEYQGAEDKKRGFKTGLKQFEDAEDISIVAAPGATADYKHYSADADAIYGHLIGHATLMRYRIAILDCPPGQGIADVRKVRAKLNSTHAAFYYPWVTVLDPVTGKKLDLPPSGFVAGIYVRTDESRGVHKAPANEVVNLAIGFERTISKAQQEVLNPEGINCFRFFEGRGFRLWGARTISSDPEWKYVNLRRYFAYLERSIEKGTQWAVFEPNGVALWANLRRAIEDFLLKEWRSGGLLGATPKEAFFVKCDRSTITQDDLDNGRLVVLIGIAPLKPAEFIIFRIGQWTADRKS